MAKKVKCINCAKSMRWALPERVGGENLDYAKHCVCIAKRSIVCDVTMKTKKISHEQYCKNYIEKNEWEKICDNSYSKEIEEIERKIEDYEYQMGNT